MSGARIPIHASKSDIVKGGKAATRRSAPLTPSVSINLHSPGEALEANDRRQFEDRLGHSLAHVRIHADATADDSAKAIGAAAFTFGQHIVFASGRFEPRTAVGQRLLAHELVHTVQQRDSVHRSPQPPAVAPAHTAHEREAETIAHRITSAPDYNIEAHSSGRTGLVRQRAVDGVIQRQPADTSEIEMPAEWAFAADKRKSKDKRYARSLAAADAARIRKTGSLSPQDKEEVNAKLGFFESEAKLVYLQTIRPALVEVTREETQMPADDFGRGPPKEPDKPRLTPYALADDFKRMKEFPEYIDNNIKEVNFFGAEVAHIHYRDGFTFKLGLVPRWMEPPIVEVDYHTPEHDFRLTGDGVSKRVGFIVESEMANAGRMVPYQELVKTYTRFVDFFLHKESVRIVPSRINMLTAPKLCRVLRDSERRFDEQTDMAAELGREGTLAVGGYAGAGGAPVNVGVGLGKTAVTRAALSPTARRLAREMDSLLAKGGTKTVTVQGVELASIAVKKQGNVLQVSRFMSRLPEVLRGKGTGLRVADAFEKAAIEVGRMNGAKTVTINVGIIVNRGWQKLLEARGYKHVLKEGSWIKTIFL